MLTQDQTVFVLVDVQGKLAEIVYESDAMLNNLSNIINGLEVLDIPIVWLEQNPKRLGPTVSQVSKQIQTAKPLGKMSFNARENDSFLDALKATGRNQVLLGGIEAHICIFQTAMDLTELGYDVQVITDAVSSRTAANKEVALHRLASENIALTSVEMCLFELMKTAEHEKFKEILPFVK